MDAKEYLKKKPEGVATLIGSGFLWAWLDSLLMFDAAAFFFVPSLTERFVNSAVHASSYPPIKRGASSCTRASAAIVRTGQGNHGNNPVSIIVISII